MWPRLPVDSAHERQRPRTVDPGEWAAFYRQELKAVWTDRSQLGGVPTEHDYWWATKQRPQLRGELNDLRTVEAKIERQLTKLG